MQILNDVSIVIPCYNGAARIHCQLDALSRQTVQGFEVVVVDNRSTDGSADAVRDYVRTHEPPYGLNIVDAFEKQGINYARNVGIRSSHGKFILLCDDDDRVSPRWVELMSNMLRSRSECVGGPMIRMLPDDTVLETNPGVVTFHWSRAGIVVSTAIGANCGFRRSAYDQLGGFDETFAGGGDENDFFFRASLVGMEMKMVDAPVAYYVRPSLTATFCQYYRYGQGIVHLHQKFASRGMPRDPWWKPIVVIGGSFVGTLLPRRCYFKRRSVEWLAARFGRISGSVRYRHVFL